MIAIKTKESCCGCGACQNACPRQCISMIQDNEGFYYPKIDETKCVKCNLCDRVCPVLNLTAEKLKENPQTYLSWANDETTRERATSGGAFAAVAYQVLKNYGYVCGAAYDENHVVRHIIIDDISDLPKLTRSKYVQSQTGAVFGRINSLLKNGKTVLFSGTACQVYGLLSLLINVKTPTDNLYTMDVICHGTPSPKMLAEYIKWHQERSGKTVKKIEMREKVHTTPFFTDNCLKVEFTDGTIYGASSELDYYGRFFLGEISSRPSCYSCEFKTIGRMSDITIGDCWFSRSITGRNDVPFDVTLCLAHSEKGKRLLKNADLECLEVDAEKAIRANGGMIYSSNNPHPKRSEFFARLGQENFGKLAEEYFPVYEKKHDFKWKLKQKIKAIPFVYEKYYFDKRESEFNERCKRAIPDSARRKTLIK